MNPATLTFLKSLKKNNNKEWFDANREKYLAAKEDVAELIDEFLKEITKFEKGFAGMSAKDCMFRIFRDVRFSKDKSPYKVNMGATMNVGGKKMMTAGFYVHVEPGKSFIAGGIWMPPGDLIKKIRQEIDYNGDKLRKILDGKEFKKYFGGFDQEYALKTTPKGYDKDHKYIHHLKLNSFIVWHPFTDAEVLKPSFARELAKGAKLMKPMVDFINTALD
ncbi:MAG: DUF2461 domain-containing protein [Bacteroidia bacterium]